MIKKNLWKIIVSSIVALLPMLFGIIVWDTLPDQMATHWGPAMTPDGFGSVGFVVFGIPSVLLAIHLLCIFISSFDKRQEQNKKIVNLTFFMIPVLSLYINGIVYGMAYGLPFDMSALIAILLGVMFIAIGNLMPKATQNTTFGIKVRWTLANKENWSKTHRFGGRIAFIGGFVILLTVFLPSPISFFVAIALTVVIALAPLFYSYFYYKKQINEGRCTKEDFVLTQTKGQKIGGTIAIVLICVILLGCLTITFTGEVGVTYGEESFTVDSVYYDPLTVTYADIDEVSYLTESTAAARVYGFGSARLSLGVYESERLGRHTRYAYTTADALVIVTVDGNTLAISGKTLTETKAIYDTLLEKTAK